jgi:ABC-type lipoprotein release transport system permease subunit
MFRVNKRSMFLIVAVMTLTFLNLVAVSGILIGLIEGASKSFREKFIGDFIVSPLENKKVIQDTESIVNILKNTKEIQAFSVRYIEQGSVESNYRQRDPGKRRELAIGNIYGIVPSNESAVTHWDKDVIEGKFLEDSDTGKIVVGKNMMGKYAQASSDKERSIGDVKIGDKLLVNINGNVNEFTLKGVMGGKTDATRQAYISTMDMLKMMTGDDLRASQIVVRVKKPGNEDFVKKVLVNNGLSENQKTQTYDDAEPSFVKDLKKVFQILGNFIGGISLMVAFITIFIVIYINAITRRKYIGIMKGIGVTTRTIELSYIIQSVFFGIVGSIIGAMIVYTILIPFFLQYPIDFPFSDGIMVAPYTDTFYKFLVLMFSTIMAGYLPSRSIINQNTLNAILGR